MPAFRPQVLLGSIALALGLAAPAVAADFPDKPITLIVPFAPGGPTDVSARLFGKVMSEQLGQPVVVDNRAGAGGSIGSAAAARSPADGYTLLWGGTSSIVVSPALYDNLGYDPIESFTPVGMAVRGPMVLAGNNDLQAADLKQLIAQSKQKPMSVASAGNGSVGHLTAEMFKSATGADLLHVPYRGGAPAMVDVLGGQIDLIFDTLTLLQPQISTDKLRAYAIAAHERHPGLPDVPTVEESVGTPFEAYSWFGLLAPAGTPEDVVGKLTQALAAGAKDPNVIEQMRATGLEPVGGTAAEFADTIQADLAKWTDVVKSANVKPE
ncbi:tripartite tricarboxylate transporter substrate binding protein [Verticiella sediminum]|uniref:Tripartite tricarboxylate transporter substrate binding protein n=1 Tax=Verticiella sediminum TaxID=1247510 RepID=A0A556AQ34_9BURK|nr:tripartite tricarboxylate transporter substrate binding protein [Verticiella sediminum]TSH95019.1 tripartite tricarboxylate transporter substrate binding protein [Verticiella sediminum]